MTGKYLGCLTGANKPPKVKWAALVHSGLAALVLRSQQKQCTQIQSRGEAKTASASTRHRKMSNPQRPDCTMNVR